MSIFSSNTDFESHATPVQRRGMSAAIWSQAFGTLGTLAFRSNILLTYLTSLHITSSRILVLLSLPPAIDALTRVVFGYFADRKGKKKLGLPGLTMNSLGFVLIVLSGFAAAGWRELLLVAGILVYALGSPMWESGWFALLSPMVPDALRGRFFGRMRTTWQLVGVIFFGICGWLLPSDAPLAAYQVVLGVIAAAMMVRMVLYASLPELERPPEKSDSFRQVMGDLLQSAGFVSFCAYVFLLSLTTAGGPIIFGLIEKKVLNFGDNDVVWLGTLTMAGSVAGFFVFGKAIDRFSTKPVFLVCHFGFSAVMTLFLLRAQSPWSMMSTLSVLHMAYGFLQAGSSIAIATEMLALIPPRNKSVSTSSCIVLLQVGTALSGLLAAWALKFQLLSDTWQLRGAAMTAYDTILLTWAVMVVLLVVTLGLVPSVIRKAEWVPRGF